MNFNVYFKERLYFALMAFISLLFYGLILSIMYVVTEPRIMYVISVYAFFILLFIIVSSVWLVGHLRGNAVKVTEKQLPEIFDVLKKQSTMLGLKKIPDMYLLQGNGILNAFAMRFTGRNYVILYSDILEAAYQEGMPAVEFIIGHELGHIKRNHVGLLKMILLFPGKLIPFLGSAYSRACEYTCDNIGYHLSPEGVVKGLLILAAGKKLYKKVDVAALLDTAENEPLFAQWFAEIFSTHPHLINRVRTINQVHNEKLLLLALRNSRNEAL